MALNQLSQYLLQLLQTEAEERAREAANLGLSRRLKESEGRGEALTDSVVELREALERQRQAADLREEMLKQVSGSPSSFSSCDVSEGLQSFASSHVGVGLGGFNPFLSQVCPHLRLLHP